MTHEPECEIAMSGVNVLDCICGYIAHAYLRGRAYERGLTNGPKGFTTVETGLLPWLERTGRAIVAAARGDKTGESAVIVHNIDNPNAIVNVRNAAVVNIGQTQNVNVWTDSDAARGGEQA